MLLLSMLPCLWSLDQLPFATLVMSDESLYVLLDFTCCNIFFHLEDIYMSFGLLLVDVIAISHARIG